MATSLRYNSESSQSGIEYELGDESSDSEPSGTNVPSGYSYDFTSTLPDELTCSICLCVFRDPHLISCCGNHFCDACISRIKSNKKPCPLCKEKDFQTMLNKSIRRQIQQLQVKCPSKGCEWIGELGSVEAHIDKLLGTCLFVSIPCDLNCGAKPLRGQLQDHKTNSCPLRSYSCIHCDLQATYKSIKDDHLHTCPKFPVACPNSCAATIERQLLDAHFKEHCPLTVQSCFFEFAGCKERTYRKDETKHAQESAADHLKLITDAYHTLKNESNRQDKEIEQLQRKLGHKQK